MIIKKKHLVIVSLLLILGLAGGLGSFFARSTEAKAATGAGKYFPLTQGSYWVYEGKGNEFAAFQRTVVFVSGDRGQLEEAGGDISGAVYQSSAGSVVRTFFSPEQYERKNLLDNPPNDHTVIINTPIRKGAVWYTSEGNRTITSTDAIVTTPAGRFKNCLVVVLQGDGYTITESFAPNVGMVKRVYRSGDIVVSSTLKKYEIKSKK